MLVIELIKQNNDIINKSLKATFLNNDKKKIINREKFGLI